jgi:hypothetical protein
MDALRTQVQLQIKDIVATGVDEHNNLTQHHMATPLPPDPYETRQKTRVRRRITQNTLEPSRSRRPPLFEEPTVATSEQNDREQILARTMRSHENVFKHLASSAASKNEVRSQPRLRS